MCINLCMYFAVPNLNRSTSLNIRRRTNRGVALCRYRCAYNQVRHLSEKSMLLGPLGAQGFKWIRKKIGTNSDTINYAVFFNLAACADDNSSQPNKRMRRYPLAVGSHIPMFFRIHLNPCAPEGPNNMLFSERCRT